MAWMDERWDDDVALLWNVKREMHFVRETSLYALGLLQRGDDASIERARRALDAVLDEQIDRRGLPFDGTFRRAPEEGEIADDAVMWIGFDPNWRQFIGTTFALIVDRYADVIGGGLERRVRASIARCVETEPDGRVSPAYANIALMKAWLDAWSGKDASAFAAQVVAHFHQDGGFLEYNSPTYYGIDLYALALWRSIPALAPDGAEIEAHLWRDIAAFYHAPMRNVSGPYDRAYGMDMTTHATPLGLWIAKVVGEDRAAPFPDPSTRFHHPHDICFGPVVAAFDARVPDDARPHFDDFQGERTVERMLAGDRRITAWLSDDVMVGGWTGPPSGIGFFQHHHATAHWRRPDGNVGWLRVQPTSPVNAVASPGRLEITNLTDAPVALDVHPEGDEPPIDVLIV